MPGKKSYSPDIPPEVWQRIIRHATVVSGVLKPELPPAFGATSSDRDQVKEFKKSLITKRNLVRVSKAWYTLASPYLFEYVLLGRHRGLHSLWEAMTRSQRAADSGAQTCSIAWWIHRLDVSMRDDPTDPEAELDKLSRIISQLSNLAVLTFSITDHGYRDVGLPHRVFQSALACRDTLKYISWHNNNLLPSQADWTHFLQNHPKLESVNALCFVDRDSNISLDYLKMVYAYATPQPIPPSPRHAELWEMDLPNVESAVYIPFGSSGVSVVNQVFFQRLGQKLKTIRVDWVTEGVQETEREEDLRLTFDEISRCCLRLERLDIALNSHYLEKFRRPDFPRGVHTFGIRLLPIQTSRRVAKALFSLLRDIVSLNPQVTTVRLLESGNLRTLRQTTIFKENVRNLGALGVEIQGPEGVHLRD